MKPLFHIPAAAGLAFLLATLCGCDESDSALVERDLSDVDTDLKLVDGSAERFRYQSRQSRQSGAARPGASGQGAPSAQSGPQLDYTLPEGWSEEPASMMRDVNLSFGENGRGECYVTRLPGKGGGLVANVNRWRRQMGAEPLTEQQVSDLPTKPLFGQPATFVSIDGDFSGMGSQGTKSDYRLLGLILASDAGAVFVKMVGPRQLVKANEEAFDTFTNSLTVSR